LRHALVVEADDMPAELGFNRFGGELAFLELGQGLCELRGKPRGR
jgi:hypothetical protein